jgi:sugar phosphate isomerase/epimerase
MARNTQPQIAATLFTLRDSCKSAPDVRKTLRRLRKIGYEKAQVSGVGVEPAELKQIADDEGVQLIGAHVGLDDFQNDLPSVVERCRAWGISYVAIPWMPADAVTTATAWRRLGERFSRIGRKLAAEGITLQYHNHMFEFQKYGGRGGVGGRTGLEILYQASDPKALQAELDVAWVARGGADPAVWCRAMKGRMDQVHIKDWAILNNEPIWTEAGEGNLDMPAVLAACKAARVKDYIVEQDNCPLTKDPFKSVAISYANLREMGLR